ncbi:MAG TPA: DUF3465 domain-containing protein [Candidatus Acidoferrales bacterium]|nr:DUF3465 domain-containing protein [Candidatus Acidoferrales bacterium]
MSRSTTSSVTTRRLCAFVLVAATGCATANGGDAGNAQVYEAWRGGRSHVEVQASGSVARVLGERTGPSGPHEGFLLHLTGPGGHGLTVRIESNLDLLGPLPVRSGEPATVRGEYEYDPRGGVIHWTHRDPRSRHPAGFVEIDGRRYQ